MIRVLFFRCVIVTVFCLLFLESVEIEEYYPEERDGLIQLRDFLSSTANLHSNWTGPPCQKKDESKWAGIGCSNWHVTRLVLEGIQLTGSLPPAFLHNLTFLTKLSFRNNSIHGPLPNLTNLINLEYVFLSSNRFSGSIPFDYVRLPKLTKLELQHNHLQGKLPPFDQQTLISFNVSYNQLEDSIPQTPVLQKFPESSYANNLDLCGTPLGVPCTSLSPAPAPPPMPSRDKQKGKLRVWSTALIAAAAAAAAVFLVLLSLMVPCCHRKVQALLSSTGRGGASSEEQPQGSSESVQDPERTIQLEFFDNDKAVMFDLDDLLRASAQEIGRGKLGTTYKAMLECGSVVAVKKLKEMNAPSPSNKEYTQQMQLLGKLKHENLVKIISFYHSNYEKLTIYEYVSNLNLFDLLHENIGLGRVPVRWHARRNIIRDIAKGLNFLHQNLPTHKVPHGNLDSSTVLIIQRGDNSQNSINKYQAKLMDYGFLPLVMSSSLKRSCLAVGKTPESAQGMKKLTRKADIYCFGIVVLEIITGRVPGDDGNELSDWVRAAVKNDWSTDIFDVEIFGEKEGYEEMLKLSEIALECADMVPERRPEMSQVLARVEEIIGHDDIQA